MGAIVVTGAYRTGTSLAMQTLRILGVPIVGLKHHPVEFPDDGFHPNGAWDLPNAETVFGINDDRYNGKAIKLFGLQLSRSKPELVDKVIVCRRNRADAVASAVAVSVARGDGMLDYGEAYDRNYLCIGCYLGLYPIPYIDLQYELMRMATETQIIRLASFLGMEIERELIDKAIDNVIKIHRKGVAYAQGTGGGADNTGRC